MTGQGKTDNKFHNDNSGFSLVELLVAVIILAIVVIPLLHLFQTSVNLNVKARTTQRATTIATDFMEGLKAYNIDAVTKEFDPATSNADFKLINNAEISSKNMVKTSTGGDNLYTLYVEGILFEKTKFNAKAIIDPGYFGKLDKSTGDASVKYALNNTNLTSVGSVNSSNIGDASGSVKKDGSFLAGPEVETEVLNKIKADLTGKGVVYDPDIDFEEISITDRETKLVFEDYGTDKKKADISITYDYKAEGVTGQITVTNADFLKGMTFESENYYFFYYPLYRDYPAVATSAKDKFIIEKKTNEPLRLFLTKQVFKDTAYLESVVTPPWNGLTIEETLTELQLTSAENSYKTEFSISDISTDDEKKLRIRTNIGTNIKGPDYSSHGSEAAYPDSWQNDEPTLKNAQFPSAVGSGEFKNKQLFTLGGKSIFGNNKDVPGAEEGVTELIYNVKVFVYPDEVDPETASDDEALVIMTGNMNN